MDNGASVTHAEDNEQAMRVLRGGKGADLLLVDVALDIRDLVIRLEAEHIHVPIVACGIASDARAAVAAIHAGAKEYIPLPPDPELIAAVLAAVANDSRDLVYRDEAMAKVIRLAQQIAGSDATSIPAPTAPKSRSSRSTARPSPSICWSPNCSAMRRAPSPAPSRAASASSRKPPVARCCWTKFRKWTCGCNRNCCARSRSA
jgi:CheY-like chemotaxis protein